MTGSSFVTLSQTTDTLCFPVPVVRKVLIAASQKKVADSLLKISEQQIIQLQATIKLLGEKDVELKTMYDGQLENLHQQVSVYKEQITGYEKLLRRERFKRRLITAAGIMATGAMFILYIIK